MKRPTLLACAFAVLTAYAKGSDEASKMTSATFEGLRLRSIGPALTSGRIGDIAVHPKSPKIYYVAAASGGVWKTSTRTFCNARSKVPT